MWYLLLAVASSTMVSVCMRLFEKRITAQMGMFAANYAVCALLSAFYMGRDGIAAAQGQLPLVLLLGVVSGVLYLSGFLFMKLNMRCNGIVLTSTFMKLGVLIPTLMAVAAFGEVPRAVQMCGFVLALAAIVLLHFDPDAVRQGHRMDWLVLLLVIGGTTDSMANVFEQLSGGTGKDLYLLTTFLAAFALAAALTFSGKVRATRKDLLYGMIIGVPNYYSSRFLLLALGRLQAVLVYPVYSVGTLVVISLIGIVLFREELSRRKAAALGMILLALVLLNL